MSQTIEFLNSKVIVDLSDTKVVYRFEGQLDEHFQPDTVPLVDREVIVFDLEGVQAFNSVGIREWIQLLRKMSALGNVRFQKCSVVMVDQFNMVPDALGGAQVISFFAPYYCSNKSCDDEQERLIDVKDHRDIIVNKKAPHMKCDKCGNKLDFDALEESYFLFMERASSKAG